MSSLRGVGFFVGGLFNIDGGNAQKFACQQLPLRVRVSVWSGGGILGSWHLQAGVARSFPHHNVNFLLPLVEPQLVEGQIARLKAEVITRLGILVLRYATFCVH